AQPVSHARMYRDGLRWPDGVPVGASADGRRRGSCVVLHRQEVSEKCRRIIGVTSRMLHWAGDSLLPGPVPQNSSTPSESPRCSEPWLPPPTCATPPQSTNS